MEEKLLTKKQVAERLQVTQKTVDNYSKKGLITKLKAGNNTRAARFRMSEVEKVFKQSK